jgi:DNA polymerase II small subunit/DNA polymerase delta subunit B
MLLQYVLHSIVIIHIPSELSYSRRWLPQPLTTDLATTTLCYAQANCIYQHKVAVYVVLFLE